MYWYNYNNIVPLLNIAKSQIFHLVSGPEEAIENWSGKLDIS